MGNPEQPQTNQPEEYQKERRQRLLYLGDFRNVLLKRDPNITENEFWEALNTFYGGYVPTIEEKYSQDNYNPSILPGLQKYIPDKIKEIDEIVAKINRSIQTRDIKEYDRWVDEAYQALRHLPEDSK